MLKLLSIVNLAVVENLQVAFQQGLNILTGETGAGKSILVDALSLLRGEKGEASLVRNGSEQAIVSAEFQIKAGSDAFQIMKELELEAAESTTQIILRRALNKTGKSKYFINDFPVTLKAFSRLGEELIDISSQFESQKLLHHSGHAAYLDAFSGLVQKMKRYKFCRASILGVLNDLNNLLLAQELASKEKEFAEFEKNQILEAQLSQQEFDSLNTTLQKYFKKSAIEKNVQEVIFLLRDDALSASHRLVQAKKTFEKIRKSVPVLDFETVQNSLVILSENLNDCIEKCEELLQESDFSENEVLNAQLRIDSYNKIIAKYGRTLEDVFLHLEKCEDKLLKISAFESSQMLLLNQFYQLLGELVSLLASISKTRKSHKKSLQEMILKELSELSLGKSVFEVKLSNVQEGIVLPIRVKNFLENFTSNVSEQTKEYKHKEIETELNKMGVFGSETVEFYLTTNVGVPLQPLEKIASGGEISRVLLAIKNILFQKDEVGFFVFDEIDSGISGSVATLVARKLFQFSQSRQALCITHLPQVACFSDSHFVVSKHVEKNKTVTKIQFASPQVKTEQIATLICGEEISEEALAQARKLELEALKFKGLAKN
jgi:DNA repair protein RecN (Recombination protein N)